MIIYTKSDGRENTDISVGRMPPWSVNTGNSVGKFTSIYKKKKYDIKKVIIM